MVHCHQLRISVTMLASAVGLMHHQLLDGQPFTNTLTCVACRRISILLCCCTTRSC